MKKTLLLVIAGLLFACATMPKYNPKEFDTANYEINVENAVDAADLLKDFEQNKILNNIPAEDLSKLVQADLYFNQGNYLYASEDFNYLAFKYKDPYIIYKAIISLEHINSTPTHAKKLKSLVNLFTEVSPESNLTKLFKISAALNSNDYVTAENNLDFLMKNNTNNGRVILLFLSSKISSNINEENHNSLINFSDYVVKTYRVYPEAHLLAVIGYAVVNSETKLSEQLEFIYKRYSNWNIPLYWASGILLRNKNIAVIKIIENKIKQQPIIEPILQNIYLSALINFNELDKAHLYLMGQLNTVDAMAKNNTLLNLGIVNAKIGNYKEAINYLTKVNIADNSIQGIVNLLIASLFDYSNDANNAIKYYQMTKLSNPYLSRIINVMVLNSYMELKRYDEIDSLLNKIIIENHLNERNAILLKASYYIGIERFDVAYNLFHDNYLKYSKDKEFLLNYGSMAAMTKKTAQAINLYKRYIKIVPNDAIAYNDLAYVLIDQTRNYKLAEIYAKKALKIAPADPNIQDTMGWLQYKLANYSDAYVYIKKAYDVTKNPQAAEHLRAVYIAMNKPELAQKVIVENRLIIQMKLKQQLLAKSLEIMMYIQYGLEIK